MAAFLFICLVCNLVMDTASNIKSAGTITMSTRLRTILLFIFNNSEAIIWLAALVVLAAVPITDAHFTLCPLKNAGFQYCPGCGLGHSIALIFHGNFTASVQMHPLGFLALGIIGWRIIAVFRNSLLLLKIGMVENQMTASSKQTK